MAQKERPQEDVLAVRSLQQKGAGRMKVRRDKVDKLFSKVIHLRDKICQACGKSSGLLDAAHLLSRRYAATRWDTANALLLCRRDHMRFTQNPEEWVRFVESRIGKEGYRILEIRAKHATTKKHFARETAEVVLTRVIKELGG